MIGLEQRPDPTGGPLIVGDPRVVRLIGPIAIGDAAANHLPELFVHIVTRVRLRGRPRYVQNGAIGLWVVVERGALHWFRDGPAVGEVSVFGRALVTVKAR